VDNTTCGYPVTYRSAPGPKSKGANDRILPEKHAVLIISTCPFDLALRGSGSFPCTALRSRGRGASVNGETPTYHHVAP
jgi:hypothetical protein